MEHDGELWQEFTENGELVEGVGRVPADFVGGPPCGASHVWIWRRTEEGNVEILLQERSPDHMSYPGYFDISAAGHIDLGETPIEAAVREAKEEIDLDISQQDLELLFRHKKDIPSIADASSGLNELQWIYLLELKNENTFTFSDNEVVSLKWVPYDAFKQGVEDGSLHVVPHGPLYFGQLYEALGRKNR
jgi:8-oxo-dGTP pyrophosphatase MutT (NUDIX family)